MHRKLENKKFFFKKNKTWKNWKKQKSEPKQMTNEVNLLIKYQPLNKTRKKRTQENNGSN